jgi:hypothetical protein
MIATFTGVAGFLLGIIVSILAYVLPMSNRLTKIETKLDVHINAPVSPCPFHEKMTEKVENLLLADATGRKK